MPSIIHSTGERDGIPNVLVEAMLHRLPVVATDVAGLGEVVFDGETGLLVPTKRSAGLSDRNLGNYERQECQTENGEKGRDLILREFDPEACHRQVFELFRISALAKISGYCGGPTCRKLSQSFRAESRPLFTRFFSCRTWNSAALSATP